MTIEWEPVDRLNSWRYGLSTATGMMPPERLINASSLQTQAWLARAPMFPATQRLPAARIAAALGRVVEPGADRPLRNLLRRDRPR